MIWVLILLAVVLLFVIPQFWGNPSFWKAAQKHAGLAYQWFLEEDCWVVQHPGDPDPRRTSPGKDLVGPFRLHVPSLGDQWIRVYGEADLMEESQRRFMMQLKGEP